MWETNWVIMAPNSLYGPAAFRLAKRASIYPKNSMLYKENFTAPEQLSCNLSNFSGSMERRRLRRRAQRTRPLLRPCATACQSAPSYLRMRPCKLRPAGGIIIFTEVESPLSLNQDHVSDFLSKTAFCTLLMMSDVDMPSNRGVGRAMPISLGTP